MSGHPILEMLERGLGVTVNSDDPAYFGGHLIDNYRLLYTEASMSHEQAAQLIRNGLEAAWLSDECRQDLLSELETIVHSESATSENDAFSPRADSLATGLNCCPVAWLSLRQECVDSFSRHGARATRSRLGGRLVNLNQIPADKNPQAPFDLEVDFDSVRLSAVTASAPGSSSLLAVKLVPQVARRRSTRSYDIG